MPLVLKRGHENSASEQALGRSVDGFSTKVHLLCDSNGYPLHAVLSPGQDHESSCLHQLLETSEIYQADERLPLRPIYIAGDKGYRADWIDEYLLEEGILPVIPSKSNQVQGSRVVRFDQTRYRKRNIVERLIGWLKESRRIMTRFEKLARNYLSMLKLAFIQRYLKLMC